MSVEMLFGALGVNAAAILAAYFCVTQLHAEPITASDIRYRMRCLQRPRYMRLEFPKSGYLQSLRFHISGTVPEVVTQRPTPFPLFFLERDSTDV